ncbi:MAG: hypothetical protein ACR2KL_10045 [Nocardioidaceae bacterium]
MSSIGEAPRRRSHQSAVGIGDQRRRFTMRLVLRMSLAVGLLVFLAVGLSVGFASDHGTVHAVTVRPLTDVTETPIDSGANTDCRATVETTRPRHVVSRTQVPCGVTKGTPTDAYLYADNTISFDDPPNRVGVWVTCFAIGAVAGLLSFAVCLVAGLVVLWVLHWREDR